MSLGREGEEFAAGYLQNLGWRVVARNFQEKVGELDIVAKEPSGVLVVVEVKTMAKNQRGLVPEDNLTRGKLQRLARTAEVFTAKHPELVGKKGWRLDLLALTKEEEYFAVNHYRNILPFDSPI